MFGWEFPPYFAGGVGTVCYELTKQLADYGVKIQYIMPYYPDNLNPSFIHLYNARKSAGEIKLDKSFLKMTRINSLLCAYQTKEEYLTSLKLIKKSSSKTNNTLKLYGEDMLDEIELFAKRVQKMSQKMMFEDFDVIHAHDWTTLPAAVAVKKLTGKPMTCHVHITEFNKTGNNTAHPQIYKIEKEGFKIADKVIAISHLIKDTLIKYYDVPEEKIEVIHNSGIKMAEIKEFDKKWLLGEQYKKDTKVVLYAGRITSMKGPLRFIEMAKKVLEHKPNTIFVIAGTGDQLNQCIKKTYELCINNKFHFFGFFNREEAEKLYDVADIFVLPSQLEPFGVTPLEAMQKKTPVVLSKQSGVSEVVQHCLFNDFWDIDKMASNVISLLTYSKLNHSIKKQGYKESKSLDWKKPAKECIALYERLIE